MRICFWALFLVLLSACGKKPAPPPSAPPAAAAVPAAPTPLHDGQSADEFFDPRRHPNAGRGTFVDPATLSPSEQKYGLAPKRDPHVTYVDDVILMEHGDQAIQNAGSDGVTFSFNANAEHVAEFAQGKVIFATGRVVGRIGQLSRGGDTVTVKLAPVQITEVIESGEFSIDAPLDSSKLAVHSAPDFPQFVDFAAGQSPTGSLQGRPSAGMVLPANFVHTQLPSQLGKDLVPRAAQITQGNPAEALDLDGKAMLAVPLHGASNNVGVSLNYGKNGNHVDASGELVVGQPKIRFLLLIEHRSIVTFGIDITGTLSIKMGINASSDTERLINVNVAGVPAFDIDLPCPIFGVPLYLSFHTSFGMKTGFSAKKTVLDVHGEYSLTGHLFAGWQDGHPSFDYPTVKPQSKLVENVSGVSMGISSMSGSFNVRPMIGIGAFGFHTGVYLGVGFSGTALNQSSAALGCRGADLTGRIDSGVGYQISGFLKTLLNALLRIYCSYQIEGTGTIKEGPSGEFIKIDEDFPKNCGGLSGGSAPAKT